MDDCQRKRFNEKTSKILEKYKDKPRLYKKMKRAIESFSGSYTKYVKPKYYRELAKLTAKIDYNCDFKDGKCGKYKESGTIRHKMCCCSNCAKYFGHFSSIRFITDYDSEKYIEEELLYYVKKYSTITGFWRKDKGCILPRERRSPTCLCYNCYGRFTTEEKLLFSMIRDKTLPSYIDIIINILKDYFLYRE